MFHQCSIISKIFIYLCKCEFKAMNYGKEIFFKN